MNQILHQISELSPDCLLWRINEKTDGSNAPKYKVVSAFYSDRSKVKHEKSTIRVTNQGSRSYNSEVLSRKRTFRYVGLTFCQ